MPCAKREISFDKVESFWEGATVPDYEELREYDIYLLPGREGVAQPSEDPKRLLKLAENFRKQQQAVAGGLSIADVMELQPTPMETLLGSRWLCRKGACLFPAPSGVGKSTLSMQMILSWAMGKPCMGINPARALSILLVQAENDAGDISEMVKGIVKGMALDADDIEFIGERTCIIEKRDATGREFLAWLDLAIGAKKPDLVVIDPLQAYLGADPTDTERVAAFCRNGLNPLLERHDCGLLLVHHTPKTNHRDTTTWKPNDWAYAAAGCADLTNWARAILVLDPVGDDRSTFKLIAAKRGGRIGWQDAEGKKHFDKYLAHAPKGIHWAEVEEPTTARRPTKADLLDFIPEDDAGIEKGALVSIAQGRVAGVNKCRSWIAELLHDGAIREVKVERPNVKSATHLVRNVHGREDSP